MTNRRSTVLNGTRDDQPEDYQVESLNKHQCKQCGNCCIIHWQSFEATNDDVLRWRRERRGDILKYLSRASIDQPAPFNLDRCPFLKKNEKEDIYYCEINDTKPLYCRIYPEDGICEHVSDVDYQLIPENR